MSCLCNLRVPFVPLSRAIAKRWQTWRDNSATNVRGKKFESDSGICRTQTNTSFSLLSFPNAYVDFPSAARAIGETQGSVADNLAAVETLLTTKLTPLLHQGLDCSKLQTASPFEPDCTRWRTNASPSVAHPEP